MRQWIATAATFTLCLVFEAGPAFAVPELFDWGFNLDGTTHCNLGPCSSDFPSPLPPAINTGGFDFNSGLGTLGITFAPGAPGNYAIDVFLDHQIDDATNGFFNEFGAASGTPAGGQSWEIDEPGFLFGDIFDNFFDSTLDNSNGVPSGSEDDVAMALGWDFALASGQSALMSFLVSVDQPVSGFFLSHTDPDSDETIFFSSTIDIQGGAPIPEPGTFLLLGSGLLGLVAHRRKRRKQTTRRR